MNEELTKFRAENRQEATQDEAKIDGMCMSMKFTEEANESEIGDVFVMKVIDLIVQAFECRTRIQLTLPIESDQTTTCELRLLSK